MKWKEICEHFDEAITPHPGEINRKLSKWEIIFGFIGVLIFGLIGAFGMFLVGYLKAYIAKSGF